MDALQQWPKTEPKPDDRRQPSRGIALAALLIAGLGLPLGACSSNTKPKSLPPQTIAPEPPEAGDPVSNQPEVGIEQIPNIPEHEVASTIDPAAEGAEEQAPIPTVEPVTIDESSGSIEDDSITMVIESPSGDDTGGEASLFAAAQAERERRAEVGESTIVLDDKTLKKYSKGNITTMDEPSGDPAEDASGDDSTRAVDEPVVEDPVDQLWEQEQYWRNRVLDIRVSWRESLDRIVELEEEVAGLRRDFYAEDDPFYRDSQIKPAWDNALDELSESKRDAERYERELSDALEEGRREGALPGWLREGIELEPSEEELAETLKREGRVHEPSEPVIVEDGASDGSAN